MENISLIVTFYSVHFAIKLESVCKKEGIEGKIIPVPRSLSSSCGMAFKGRPEDKDGILDLAHSNGIEIEDIVEYVLEERKSILHKLFSKN